jgi:SAM-dependent methyltransferase
VSDHPPWDESYRGTPPWDIGRPQPAFAHLADQGAFAGRVLDAGCGTGEHTLLAASCGADALGVDISSVAIERARAKARERGVDARFEVRDALALEGLGQFDVALDSGLYHVWDDEETRAAYARRLASVVAPGGVLYLMCFSEHTPGDWGPSRIRQEQLRASFADGWSVESIEPSRFELAPVLPYSHAEAWFATIRRE